MRPTPRKPRLSSGKIRAFTPLLARTSTVHRPLGPVSYDCVKVIVVRKGSAILSSEFGSQPVKPGDVIALGANVLCGSEPEESITVTTIYLDTDFVLDQVRWQYAGFLDDRLDTQGFANTIYTEPAQILRLGEDRGGMLMPWPDELVTLSIDGDFVRHYYRMQALWFQIAYVIAASRHSVPMCVGPQTCCGRTQRGVGRPRRRSTPVTLAAVERICRGVRQDPAGVSDDAPRRETR